MNNILTLLLFVGGLIVANSTARWLYPNFTDASGYATIGYLIPWVIKALIKD